MSAPADTDTPTADRDRRAAAARRAATASGHATPAESGHATPTEPGHSAPAQPGHTAPAEPLRVGPVGSPGATSRDPADHNRPAAHRPSPTGDADPALPPVGLADRVGAPDLAARLLSCWRALAASPIPSIVEDSAADGRPAHGQPHHERPADGRLLNERPFNARPCDGRPSDRRPFDGQPLDKQPFDRQPYGERPFGERPFGERPADGRACPGLPADIQLAFASGDPAGTIRLVRSGWRPPPGDAADHRAVAARLARRIDRAAALAVPWSRYDEALELLLASTGPDAGTPSLTFSLRLGPPGRPAALRIHSPDPGPALGSPPDLDSVGTPAGLSVRLQANRPGGLRWYHTGTEDGLSELDTLARRYRVPDVTPIRRLLTLLPPVRSGDAVLWWLQPEPGWFGAIVDGARLGGRPGAAARLDSLLHTLRHHAVGYRAAAGLTVETPERIGIAVPAGHAAATVPPVLSIACRPRYTPPRTTAPAPSRHPHAGPLRRAVRFLLDAQSPGGGWWDLAVNAGSSGPWLTAVVGLALAGAPTAAQTGVGPALRRAGRYLRAAQRPGGWGWNEALEPDCDSTAHAILLLHRLSGDVNDAAVRGLLAFQTADGAFRTYRDAPPGHSWGEVHHDVHPAALRALHAIAADERRSAVARPAIDAGLPVLAAGLRLDPPWPAFWWTTTEYGAYVNLLCLSELGRMDMLSTVDRDRIAAIAHSGSPHAGTTDAAHAGTPHTGTTHAGTTHAGTSHAETPHTGTALETALAASVALLAGRPSAEPLLQRLCASQRVDGSWDAEPALRVVEATCAQPWRPELAAVAGTVYPETARVFTTAMALTALQLAASP